jgi:hypothetical protein
MAQLTSMVLLIVNLPSLLLDILLDLGKQWVQAGILNRTLIEID